MSWCSRGHSFLWSGFLGLLNCWNSSVDHLGVDLGSCNWNRCADNRGIGVLGVSVLGDIVRVGGGIGKVSVLDIGNNDALLRLDSYDSWFLNLDFDRGRFFLSLNCHNFSGRSLSNRGNGQVGSSHPESKSIRNVVGGLDDSVGIDVRVGSPDNAVGSLDLALGRVLVAVAIVVLANLILSVELVSREDWVGVSVDWCVSVVTVRSWLGRHQAD